MPVNATDQFFMNSQDFEPAYLALLRNGELARRVEHLRACALCPRECRVDRLDGALGVCKIGRFARVSSTFAHMGEEDPLRGWRGSGTIFFSGCNLRCVFCQNFDISQIIGGMETEPVELAAMMLDLQSAGCHNINFVTPEHVVPQVLEGLLIAAAAGLRLPIVYNTSAYDSLESLRLLDGVVDIYMPDFKFWDEHLARRYVRARDYPAVARQSIREMQRQVGALRFDEHGLAKRGLLLRHLVMPGCLADTRAILKYIADEISPDTYVNVMAQYYPAGKVADDRYAEINRRLTASEYRDAVHAARTAGLHRLDKRPLVRHML